MAAAVQFLLAVGARVGWGAAAHVASGEAFLTRSSVKTRIICTRHCDDLTVFPIEALRASARVIVLQILHHKRQWVRESEREREFI